MAKINTQAPEASPVADEQAPVVETPALPFADEVAAAEAAGAKAVQVVYSGQPGAQPALRVDH